MKTVLKRSSIILLAGLLVLSMVPVWFGNANCEEEGNPPDDPPDPPDPDPCDNPCGDKCCDGKGPCCPKTTTSGGGPYGGGSSHTSYDCCEDELCEFCVNGDCKYRCDPDNCEECVDGDCKVCGGDPGQRCCNGLCCYKNWTTRTIEEGTIPCGDCWSSNCAGSMAHWYSYVICHDAGEGQGEHCICNSQLKKIGYEWQCYINWDISAMVWCATQYGFCIPECLKDWVEKDPASCSLCLTGKDCCGGSCELCDFVSSCEHDDPYDAPIAVMKSLVFWKFGC